MESLNLTAKKGGSEKNGSEKEREIKRKNPAGIRGFSIRKKELEKGGVWSMESISREIIVFVKKE